jgi:hypothetical protein
VKAMVCTKYGPPDVLESTEVEIPAPQDDEVLGETVWVVWLGIVWFRASRSAATRKLRSFFAARFGKRVATTQDPTPTRGES